MRIPFLGKWLSIFFLHNLDFKHLKYSFAKKSSNVPKKNKVLLWLDDSIDPMEEKMDWLSFSPVGREVDVTWVKNFHEFQKWISKKGLPDAICFDDNLGKNEPTGYDCAKWLIKYCREHKIPLPLWTSQSADPIEKAKIKKLLKTYS